MQPMDRDTFLELFRKSPGVRELRLAPGATVFRQGDPGDAAFVVASGKLGIFRESSTGQEMIAQRGYGHLVGEMALFGHKRRSASLVALDDSSLLRLDAEDVLRLMRAEPELAIAINGLLVARLQELMERNLEDKNRQLDAGRLELEAAMRELQAVVDRSAQGIVCLGASGQLRFRNARVAELLGLPPGRGLDVSALPAALRRWLRDGRGAEALLVDGRTLLAEAEALPAGGRVVFLTAREEVGRMARALSEDGATFTVEDILGVSAPIVAVREHVRRAARTDSSVLIEGETGTGKELAAQAIHNASNRWHRPFVPINCAAIPQELLESELFGHEKGAFTGASTQRSGKFEQAQGGTLFLDEIGDMPIALQAKILRVLQERKVHRLGGRRGIALDVRIVAATNVDLAAAVATGAFRRDLYYRIAVLRVCLPPLRERKSDIPLLAQRFLERLAARQNKRLARLSPGAESRLLHHAWPGNVRELENVLEREVSLAGPQDEVLRRVELPAAPPAGGGDKEAIVPLEQLETQAIRRALQATGGHVEKAAMALGISRASVFRKLKRYGIDRKQP
jgi:DNA-binding NtrC family response regulator/CRP-like cAMP-binding protein